jgi:hypothetical protein
MGGTKRNILLLRIFALLPLLFTVKLPLVDAPAFAVTSGMDDTTLVLADPSDPYYSLAEKIAQYEALPIVHTLDQVLEQGPTFLLWVVSPAFLSDDALVEFGLAVRDRPSVISVGILSGSTQEEAHDLWWRAADVKGEQIAAVSSANPHGHVEAKITLFDGGQTTVQPLTRANLLQSLQTADYLTFTGHGGTSFLAWDKGAQLRPADIPALSPTVIATASCNTFRPWEEDSIALAFIRQGAAAYAGFAYSPNAGYLIGAYRGVPFRYTWPGFPIGHAVQVQNHGTLQGFAQIPFYYLLGDPRIALQGNAPYRLVQSHAFEDTLTLSFAGAPSGVIPVRIPNGARYSFVKIPGISAAWEHDPFYNARLQMVNLGGDKLVLFAHEGGDFDLHLRPRPPWYWLVGDPLLDALDHTLLYLQNSDRISLVAGGLALVPVLWLVLRKRASIHALLPAALTGLGFASLHGLYTLARLDRLTITSKSVQFTPLSLVATFFLAGCGAFLYVSAKSWRGRAIAVLVASLGALAPAVLVLSAMAIGNTAMFKPRLGTSLYNYSLGLQPLITLAFEWCLFGLAFLILRRTAKYSTKETVSP